MAELFDDISRMVGGSMPRREVIRLAAAALAGSALAALWPARVKANGCEAAATTFPGCNTYFDVQAKGSVDGYGCTDADLSAACDAAKQGVQNAAGSFSCPAACPVLEVQTAPHCVCVECQATGSTGLGGEVIRKVAVAAGTYRCVCPSPRTICNGVCCAEGQTCCGTACWPKAQCCGGTTRCSKTCDANGRCSDSVVSPWKG